MNQQEIVLTGLIGVMHMVTHALHGTMQWKVQDHKDVVVDMIPMTLMLQSSAVRVKKEEASETMTVIII